MVRAATWTWTGARATTVATSMVDTRVITITETRATYGTVPTAVGTTASKAVSRCVSRAVFHMTELIRTGEKSSL